jgi:nicotinate-nucleotide pyrophosphorylase (carboxylating)
VLTIEGRPAGILTAERTALNVLGRLSGVATATARAVRRGGGDRRADPRHAQDHARHAAAREGRPSRRAAASTTASASSTRCSSRRTTPPAAGGVGAAVRKALAERPDLLVEAECRDRAEVDEALAPGAPRLLLDNMTPGELRAMVEHVAGRAELEASGGITLANLREVAQTGVDFISLGALTHSAPALDLSLLLDS